MYTIALAGFVFEEWVELDAIPAILAAGLEYVFMDNATPHRKNVLRGMFAAAGLEVYFLPPYSPWYARLSAREYYTFHYIPSRYSMLR